jgi:hypothetical protein
MFPLKASKEIVGWDPHDTIRCFRDWWPDNLYCRDSRRLASSAVESGLLFPYFRLDAFPLIIKDDSAEGARVGEILS